MGTANGAAEYIGRGPNRISKIDRYKWSKSDHPGSLEMIDKRLLNVDPVYQRPENQGKIRTIARDWSHIACGALIVALRPDSSYYVMDGGHRACAARLRADIEELPCIVFLIDDVEEEAKGFLAANTLRKPVTAIEKFRAQIVAGNPVAVKVKELLDAAGYRICLAANEGSQTVKCVKALADCYQVNPELFTHVWPLVLAISAGGPIHERVVESVIYIESKMRRQDLSLTKNPWKERLLKLGSRGILDAAAKASAYYARGGARVWASGVVDAMNRGTRNRLILDQTPEEIEAG